mmetsp:Transcript_33202/g.82644  ORF Transcript_33202/g.82644 Transcript_33202/m.82644 type:complete len:232 (-) Transcript_33202:132-827(-)
MQRGAAGARAMRSSPALPGAEASGAAAAQSSGRELQSSTSPKSPIPSHSAKQFERMQWQYPCKGKACAAKRMVSGGTVWARGVRERRGAASHVALRAGAAAPSSTCRQMCRWASRASWRWFPYCGSTRSRRSFGYSGCKTASDSPSVASPPPGMARRARTASCTASARWGRSPRRGSAASPQSRLRARSPCIGWICNSCHTESSTCSPSSPAPTPRAPAPAACSDLTARPL